MNVQIDPESVIDENVTNTGDLNQTQYHARSDDDDDEEFYCMRRVSNIDSLYSHVRFDDISDDCRSSKIHPDEGVVDAQNTARPLVKDNFDTETTTEVQKSVEHNIAGECNTPCLYVVTNVDTEPVDFENNGLLWQPPEPDDEKDESDTFPFEDDDEGGAAGEWGYMKSSSGSAYGEARTRDITNEEHNRAMKNAVDGHFRALVTQLLQVENVASGDETDEESWLAIITSLSWDAAMLLKPDMSNSAKMDPGAYVKIKCLASGSRSESMVIRGVVCTKNVAHRRMTSKIEKPRVLLLGESLEYQRASDALSSFDTLLQQEMDHLKMALARIESHRPNVLLVEKSVSRYAQECLVEKDISVVLNVKRPLMERIARCTGSQIIPSIDHLSSQKLGYCDLFHVEKFVEEHDCADQAAKKPVKTLMFFEGCPKPLGCTILLRGANTDELKKVKHVLHYGVFAAYHLALETSFLADEGASLIEFPLRTPINVVLPDQPLKFDRSISTVHSMPTLEAEKFSGPPSADDHLRSNSLPCPKLEKLAVEIDHHHDNHCSDPSCLSSAESLQDLSSNELPNQSALDEELLACSLSSGPESFQVDISSTAGNHHHSHDIAIEQLSQSDGPDVDAIKLVPTMSFVLDDLEKETDYTEEFPPSSDQQSILVSLSSRCVWKGTVCERPHFFRIKFYGSSDMPLGRFLRDHLFNQNDKCRFCEMPPEGHIQCYTHRQGTLTISVKTLQETVLPGEKDGKIWMWHRCLKCPRADGFPPATRRVLMSDAAWGLSFGKFLELSFSNHAAASRTASCGHSLHKACLRFYGFGKMVACFRYAAIDVYSVYLPPSKLEFNYGSQDWVEKQFDEVAARAELLFSEVLNALRILAEKKSSLNSIKVFEARRYLTELEEMLQKEKSEFEETLKKISEKETIEGKSGIDILELNRLHRDLVFKSYIWDYCLKGVDSLNNESLPDESQVNSSESVQKNTALSEEPPENSNSIDEDANSGKRTDLPLSDGPVISETFHHKVDFKGSDDQNSVAPGEPETIVTPESDVTGDEAPLSDSLGNASLPETLDEAWTRHNSLVTETIEKHYVPESVETDSVSTTGMSEKFDKESQQSDLAFSDKTFLPLFSKSSNDTEYRGKYSIASFMESFASLSVNGNAPNFDSIIHCDPVYFSSFWDPELQGGARLLLSTGVNGTVIPVYDDEPTSLISYALVSPDYHTQASSDELPGAKGAADSEAASDVGNFHLSRSFLDLIQESYRTHGSADDYHLPSSSSFSSLSLDQVALAKALHVRVSFSDDGPLGKAKYTVTCYYARHFEALRRECCPSEIEYVRSLSRCRKWGAQGGKSKVFFAKTLDDRFIVKQVTKTELESFLKFGPEYFKYLSESIDEGSPTCLAKILGIYQVASKHVKGGKESKMDLLVIENLFFRRNMTRLYDLKGSTRSRYNSDSSGNNRVLLDENLLEAMPTSPIFMANKAKRIMERAVWNDTSFLASVDVMDYSLLVGVDEERHELVVGIIDFLRQYTWDKHLETWVKASGFLGGPKNVSPTVISPKQYKKRFRKAMNAYFLVVPDQWLFGDGAATATAVPNRPQMEFSEDIGELTPD